MAILPTVLRDPQAFYFGNVVFHALRDPGATRLSGQLAQKWSLLLAVLPYRGAEGPFTVQFLGLLLLGIAGPLSRLVPRNQLTTSLWVVLFFTSLLPTPSYPQYFCLLIPFLILDAVTLLASLPLRRTWPFLAPAALAYATLGATDGHRYLLSGMQVPGVMSTDRIPRWSIDTVERVGKEIDARNAPEAISWWPGYFISTRTAIATELANDFGMVVAGKLTAAERKRLHLVTHGEVGSWIEERKFPLVVAGNWTASQEADLLPKHGYQSVYRYENVTLWALPRP
jgi:hypothetical protein